MPALGGAVAFEQMDGVAVPVGEDLDLHVARLFEVFLHDQAVVAAVQDFMNIAACCRYEFSRVSRQRHLRNDGGRVCHVLDIDDTDIVGLGGLHDESWLIDSATPCGAKRGAVYHRRRSTHRSYSSSGCSKDAISDF